MRSLDDEHERPRPVEHPDTAPFWAGLAEGELRVQRCTACGTHRYPFAPVCHVCGSFEFAWEPMSGDGTVAVSAMVHRATGDREWAAFVPFRSGLVDMEHGVRLPGRILCTCGEGGRRGAVVEAIILSAPDGARVHGFAHSCLRDR